MNDNELPTPDTSRPQTAVDGVDPEAAANKARRLAAEACHGTDANGSPVVDHAADCADCQPTPEAPVPPVSVRGLKETDVVLEGGADQNAPSDAAPDGRLPTSLAETEGRVLAAEQMFRPHQDARPGQTMAQLNHLEADKAAMVTRSRLSRAASAAFAQAWDIPADHVVMHELSSIDPDGTHRVRFYFVNKNDAEYAEMDAHLRIAEHFERLGWRFREDGALMRPCDNCSKGKGKTGAPPCKHGGICTCGCSVCDETGESVEVAGPPPPVMPPPGPPPAEPKANA